MTRNTCLSYLGILECPGTGFIAPPPSPLVSYQRRSSQYLRLIQTLLIFISHNHYQRDRRHQQMKPVTPTPAPSIHRVLQTQQNLERQASKSLMTGKTQDFAGQIFRSSSCGIFPVHFTLSHTRCASRRRGRLGPSPHVQGKQALLLRHYDERNSVSNSARPRLI